MLVVVLSVLALIVVDQRSVADALPLTQTSDADPLSGVRKLRNGCTDSIGITVRKPSEYARATSNSKCEMLVTLQLRPKSAIMSTCISPAVHFRTLYRSSEL